MGHPLRPLGLVKYRTHMLDHFKDNFKGSYVNPMCRLCMKHEENQDLIQECTILKKKVESENVSRLYKEQVQSEDVKTLEKVIHEIERFKESNG